MIYDKLALKPGDKVLIGECVQVCGFDSDMQARMDGRGHIDIVDITDQARRAYIDGGMGARYRVGRAIHEVAHS